MRHAYIGNGKGKTTAGIGLLVRALGAGKRVGAIFFDKAGEDDSLHEVKILRRLQVPVLVMGLDRREPDGGFRVHSTVEDGAAARKALDQTRLMIESGQFELLLLDEVISCISRGLVGNDQFLEAIAGAGPELELVCTGRCRDEGLLGGFDLISRIEKVRHYFDQGVAARPGIEF